LQHFRLDSSRKGIHLLTRQGFINAVAELSQDEIESLAFARGRQSPFDAADIRLRVAKPAKPAAGWVHFDIHVDSSDLLLEKQGERFRGELSVMVALYYEGFLKGALPPSSVDIDLTQAELDAVSRDGILISRDVSITNDIQKARVLVYDRNLDALGSVTIPIN